MNSSLYLGRIWGIPIRLHISWFLIFGLIVYSLGTGYFPDVSPQTSSLINLGMALATSLLFFASVLAHELGHSLVALREKIPVKHITLFIFGGVASIEREPASPGAEFRVAIAGPLTSLGLGLIFGAIWFFNPSISALAAPAMYLARLNLILALFNMVPGFPLDGGRVLRAVIWQITKSYTKATKVASTGGKLVAYGFIAYGVMNLFLGQYSNGLWMAMIGWFLQNAAASAAYQAKVQEKLSGLTVAQAMSEDWVEIPALTTLSQVVDGWVLTQGRHAFYISDSFGQVRGILTLEDITQIDRNKWRFVTAEQVMKPLKTSFLVTPSMDLLDALKAMEVAKVSQAAVVQDNQLIGTLSSERVMQNIQMRTRLGM